MINEITNKVIALDYSRNSINKKNNSAASDRSVPAGPSDLNVGNSVDVTSQTPVEIPVDIIIAPVHVQEHAIQMQPDVHNKKVDADRGRHDISNGSKLSDEERKEIEELQKRDKEVREHEYAHAAAGGVYAQGISFQYQVGPDGKRYAVGGEVSIDTSPVYNNPDATIAKARTIRAAANAPADPSAQDRQVAAAATRMEASARAEKAQEASETRENEKVGQTETDTAQTGRYENNPVQEAGETEESVLTDALTTAYGKKETEVGKVLRMTV